MYEAILTDVLCHEQGQSSLTPIDLYNHSLTFDIVGTMVLMNENCQNLTGCYGVLCDPVRMSLKLGELISRYVQLLYAIPSDLVTK